MGAEKLWNGDYSRHSRQWWLSRHFERIQLPKTATNCQFENGKNYSIRFKISNNKPTIRFNLKWKSLFAQHQNQSTPDTFSTHLSGHNQCTCCRVNGDITGHQSNILELLKQLTVLLVAERLDWRRVDHSLFIPQWHGHSVPAMWHNHNVILELSREHLQTVNFRRSHVIGNTISIYI